MAEEMIGEAKEKESKASLRKKRLTVLLILLGVMAVLLLLNAIDFENVTPPAESTEEYAPVTQPIQNFYEPDYESDITKDKGYMSLDRLISYTYSGQTVVLEEGRDLPDKAFTRFFLDYFEAMQKGFGGSEDEGVGFNALYSEIYYRTHTTFGEFAPQKVYDIEITRMGEIGVVSSVDNMADQPYLGASVGDFEVRYKIYKNDGTFRRDISEEDVIPLIFTVMAEKNGKVSVNRVSYIRYENPSDVEGGSLLPLVLPIVWLATVPILAVLGVILKKKLFFAFAAVSFIAFLFSTFALVWVQILVFCLGVGGVFGGYYFLKKKKPSAEETAESEEN